MSEIDSGGPAFSGSYKGQQGEIRWSEGMSKREYFAGMALQGMLSNPTISIEKSDLCGGAFDFADRMIRAGKGGKCTNG